TGHDSSVQRPSIPHGDPPRPLTGRCPEGADGPGFPTTAHQSPAGRVCHKGTNGRQATRTRFWRRTGLRNRILQPSPIPGDPGSEGRAAVPVAESVRGTPHRDPAPRVARPRGGAQRDPPGSLAARLPHLLPPCPDPPLTGEGLPGAKTGGAPRPGRNRRDAHGRRPASSVHTAGCVSACLPAGRSRHHGVGGRGVRLAVLAPPPLWV